MLFFRLISTDFVPILEPKSKGFPLASCLPCRTLFLTVSGVAIQCDVFKGNIIPPNNFEKIIFKSFSVNTFVQMKDLKRLPQKNSFLVFSFVSFKDKGTNGILMF